MNQTYIKYFFFASIFIVLFSSCLVEPKYPIEPRIGFKSFEFLDNTEDSLLFSFTYRDGDGDLGLAQPGKEDPKFDPLMIVKNPDTGLNDTVTNPLYFNVFIDFLAQNAEGGFDIVPIPDELIVDGRIPRLADQSKPKPIEGDITFNQQITRGLRQFISDKVIKARVSIRDRALHMSNEIETDTIRIPKL